MRILIAIQHFDRPNGAASYALITARHLARLGHEVGIHTPDAGAMAEIARAAGIAVADDESEPPDAILSQDRMVAFTLAERWPGVPQVFVAHGAYRDEAMPPQLPAAAVATVALNDRVAGRVRALAADVPVIRLRQPIDVELFRPRGRPSATPRQALLFGNYLTGAARDRVIAALERAGMEASQLGWHGRSDAHPERALAGADVVVGYGRCALEAMASGRPTYVLDHRGGDGWVTSESYPRLEANGFAGTATDESLDVDALTAAFRAYDPELGELGRKLVARHHDAFHHAIELSEALKRLAAPAPLEPSAATELGRLSRLQWESEWRAGTLLDEVGDVHERLRTADEELHAARERIAQLEREHAELRATRRYRLAAVLARPLDRARRRGMG